MADNSLVDAKIKHFREAARHSIGCRGVILTHCLYKVPDRVLSILEAAYMG